MPSPEQKTDHAVFESPEFVIACLIDANCVRTFQAWTDAQQLAQWWGPKDVTNTICEMDVRPGGVYRIIMCGPDGVEYPVQGRYVEVVEAQRIVMTDDWTERPAQWQKMLADLHKDEEKPPQEARNTVTFEARNGSTLLTIRARFSSLAVRDAMVKIGMTEAWRESLMRLDKLLTLT